MRFNNRKRNKQKGTFCRVCSKEKIKQKERHVFLSLATEEDKNKRKGKFPRVYKINKRKKKSTFSRVRGKENGKHRYVDMPYCTLTCERGGSKQSVIASLRVFTFTGQNQLYSLLTRPRNPHSLGNREWFWSRAGSSVAGKTCLYWHFSILTILPT